MCLSTINIQWVGKQNDWSRSHIEWENEPNCFSIYRRVSGFMKHENDAYCSIHLDKFPRIERFQDPDGNCAQIKLLTDYIPSGGINNQFVHQQFTFNGLESKMIDREVTSNRETSRTFAQIADVFLVLWNTRMTHTVLYIWSHSPSGETKAAKHGIQKNAPSISSNFCQVKDAEMLCGVKIIS